MSDIRGQYGEQSYAWRELLQRWSDEWLDPVLHEQEGAEPFSEDVRRARWLGRAGANLEEVGALEDRLGTVLPASYRQFLLTSDGWLNTTSDIERILSAHEVGWTRDLDPDLVTVWSEADGAGARIADEEYFVYGEAQAPFLLRPEYMPHTLKISHTPEATDVYLLNPCVVTADGEWEAWFVAHWLPGAVRYQSFWDLMNDEYRRFRGDW
ncbi:SMI1/KNR4 family protein [Streptomyces sp. NBC_01762]|uniref:SMI1/KNR4 family protein n=1 Tax=unclassified Streptomyces TaxID=2593676 RepID=UPI002DDBE502|nr:MULTISPECIES: SMI1/KNR4 family protein [unclassified Streptomyces]WSC40035.1 SMI1/KNR4 family protein [Streptomyces sp. NBC_01763]WSC48203.1 SMI1/KNR4 family protein [Streptomyces sp. NBC_01762]WSD27852.1 SMI1/KNR4 family protein [Streptomyces sp. NBC_01751]WSJ50187.1 SMI1/KNR4 family protein [Streptomyces sp. NBC_01318]